MLHQWKYNISFVIGDLLIIGVVLLLCLDISLKIGEVSNAIIPPCKDAYGPYIQSLVLRDVWDQSASLPFSSTTWLWLL